MIFRLRPPRAWAAGLAAVRRGASWGAGRARQHRRAAHGLGCGLAARRTGIRRSACTPSPFRLRWSRPRRRHWQDAIARLLHPKDAGTAWQALSDAPDLYCRAQTRCECDPPLQTRLPSAHRPPTQGVSGCAWAADSDTPLGLRVLQRGAGSNRRASGISCPARADSSCCRGGGGGGSTASAKACLHSGTCATAAPPAAPGGWVLGTIQRAPARVGRVAGSLGSRGAKTWRPWRGRRSLKK